VRITKLRLIAIQLQKVLTQRSEYQFVFLRLIAIQPQELIAVRLVGIDLLWLTAIQM
jgi:hypothetical protein